VNILKLPLKCTKYNTSSGMQLPKHEGLQCGSAFWDTNFISWLVDVT